MTDVPTRAARACAGAARIAVLSAMMLVGLACAARSAPVTGAPQAAESSKAPPDAPRSEPLAAKALDPERAAGPCAAYTFDGITIGMTRPEVEKTVPLVALPHEASLLAGFENTTFAFSATRPGRYDDVQVGFGPRYLGLEYLRASVLVAPDDAWPRVLFDSLGSPKLARVGEYIWYDMRCGFTLRLVRVESLGGGEAQAYTLEIRRTAKPVD